MIYFNGRRENAVWGEDSRKNLGVYGITSLEFQFPSGKKLV